MRVVCWLLWAAVVGACLAPVPALADVRYSGFVRDASSGEPLSGVELVLHQQQFMSLVPVVSATSAADGSYEVLLEGSNSYWLVLLANHTGYREGRFFDESSFQAGERQHDFTLYPLGEAALTVTVRDQDTLAPIGDTLVQLEWDDGDRTVRADENGVATVSLGWMGPWRVCAYDEAHVVECWEDRADGSHDPVWVTDGASIALTMDLEKLPSIGGRLLKGDGVTPMPHRSFTLTLHGADGDLSRSSEADANGEWREYVPAGSYRVSVKSFGSPAFAHMLWPDVPCPPDLGCPLDAGTVVEVGGAGPQDVDGIDFVLPQQAGAQVQVLDALGDPLPGISVTAYSDGLWMGWMPIVSDVTDAAGMAELPYLPAGQPTMVATRNLLGYIDQRLPNWISPAHGDVLDLQFTLPRGSAIAGSMRSGLTGRPLPASLRVYDAEGDLVYLTGLAGGDYMTAGLQPGVYYAIAYHHGPDLLCILYDALPCTTEATVASDGVPIVLTEGSDTLGVDFLFDDVVIHRSGFE